MSVRDEYNSSAKFKIKVLKLSKICQSRNNTLVSVTKVITGRRKHSVITAGEEPAWSVGKSRGRLFFVYSCFLLFDTLPYSYIILIDLLKILTKSHWKKPCLCKIAKGPTI